jgi:hypothetical protein
MWVDDRMVATPHTREWGLKFKHEMLHEGKLVELFDEDEVAKLAVSERGRLLQQIWLSAFERQMRATYEATWTNEGFWSNAHMLYGQGLSVSEAVKRAGNKQHLNLKRKRTP